MATTGTRGKWAEGEVRKYLVAAERGDTAFYRPPDARAGSLQAVMADFMTLRKGLLTLIEVKEVEHASRLPYKNFSADKVARMRVWQLAGAEAWVIVCHRVGKVRTWRLLPLDVFIQRDADTPNGSWQLGGLGIAGNTLSAVMEKVI